MKKTARILIVVFTVVSLFGSTLTAQAAIVKNNKKAKYYKTASTKKKAGTLKKVSKIIAVSMSKGFVKFKSGKKTLYIKVTDVKISGKYTAKVTKKTKAYNKKLKATKTVLKKNKSLTISGMKVKKKVAYLKYASGKFVKATDVKVISFVISKSDGKETVAPTVIVTSAPTEMLTPIATITPDANVTLLPTEESTVIPDITETPISTPIPDEFLGPNLIPAEKSTFDYWANGAHEGESLASIDHSGRDSDLGLTYSITDGYGKLAEGDPIPDNYTYNLKYDTGALVGYWYFQSGYGTDYVNNIQGLTNGLTYQITFDYYCPFENDFRLVGLQNGEYAVDENGEYILDDYGDRKAKNCLPNGQPIDLIATDEWKTFSVTAKFSGRFLLTFGMWNPAAETLTGVFIDNFTIRAVLDSASSDTSPITPAPTKVPISTPIPDEFLGPNLIPAEKSTFDYWANGAHEGESLASADHMGTNETTGLTYSITDGYGKLAEGDPIPDNYTYNLKYDTGALWGHWYFQSGYGADSVNGIQGLTNGVTYQISFDYYCPFENDFRLVSLQNGEYAVDENGEYILNDYGNKTVKNCLPNGQSIDLIANDDWQTFSVTARFSGQFLLAFGMWNPAAETTTGVFIDNFSIRQVLDIIPATESPIITPNPTPTPPVTEGLNPTPTPKPSPMPAPTEDVDGVLTYNKVFTTTDYKIAVDQAYGGAFTWSADDYALAITAGYSHVIFHGALYASTFPSSGTYRVVINGKFAPSSVTQTDAMSYSTSARREKTEADGLVSGETVGDDGKVYKDGQVVYLNGNSVKDHESFSQVKPITTNTDDQYSNHVFDIEVKEGANEFMMHLIPGYSGETNYLRSMQIYKLNN